MPLELPDRRAVWCILPVMAIGLAHLVFIAHDEHSTLARASEYLLYLGIALAGVALAMLSVKEGFNIFRPSKTRDSGPLMFWVDVLFYCPGLPIAAAWFAWESYAIAS